MVVMAGGEGTRLRPLTEDCPKPLLPVGGRPMLEHILERAIAEGFKRFVFAIRYLGHMIEDHFGDGGDWGVEIDYLREGEPLGTAGALSLLKPGPGEPFIVSNGDVLTAIRYGEMLDFHVSHDATATMAVRLHEWQHPFGVVHTEGLNLVGFEEKPVDEVTSMLGSTRWIHRSYRLWIQRKPATCPPCSTAFVTSTGGLSSIHSMRSRRSTSADWTTTCLPSRRSVTMADSW
jgi:NDP-sugar pyrophosphorylase family protein